MCVQTLPSITAVSAPWHLERLCSLRAELFSVHSLLHTREMAMNYLFRIWKQQESTVEKSYVRENNFILETLQNKPEQVKREKNILNNWKSKDYPITKLSEYLLPTSILRYLENFTTRYLRDLQNVVLKDPIFIYWNFNKAINAKANCALALSVFWWNVMPKTPKINWL